MLASPAGGYPQTPLAGRCPAILQHSLLGACPQTLCRALPCTITSIPTLSCPKKGLRTFFQTLFQSLEKDLTVRSPNLTHRVLVWLAKPVPLRGEPCFFIG